MQVLAFKGIHGCACSELGVAGLPNANVIVVWERTHPGPEEVTPNSHSTPAVKCQKIDVYSQCH